MASIFLTIPTFAEPLYEQSVTLGNQTYVLTFKYSTREHAFYMDLATVAGERLVDGVKLVTGSDLLRPYKYNTKIPQELLALYANGDDDSSPDLEDLGARVELVYVVPEA